MAPSTTAADLPSVLLVKILEMVPQSHRLGNSALVRKSWASAATAATSKVSLEVNPDTLRMQAGVHSWLRQHSSILSSLELRSPSSAALVEDDSLAAGRSITLPLHLQCADYAQLTSLSLETMDLTYSTDEPTQAQQQQGALPQLAELKLSLCGFSRQEAFLNLASSARLTALDLRRLWWAQPSKDQQLQTAPGADSPPPALTTVLHCCSSLQRLHLQSWSNPRDKQRQAAFMPHSSLSAISSLLQLEDLTLCNLYARDTSQNHGLPARAITNLPPSLTRLRVAAHGDVDERFYRPYYVSETLCHLTRLKTLELIETPFCPHSLAGLTDLQRLVVSFDEACTTVKCLLVSAHDAITPFATLLSSIGNLKQLQVLTLKVHEARTFNVGLPRLPSCAFAALTASSQLQDLRVKLSNCACAMGEGIMPGSDVLQHMFAPGQHLEQLHSLALGSAYCDDNNWGLPVEDLQRVAASCPALHTLDIGHLLENLPCADFTPLLIFTSCERLYVGGQQFDDRAAPIVAQLTQLTYLEWDCSREYDVTCLTRVGLAKLTALTGLQELHLTENYWHQGVMEFMASQGFFKQGLELQVPHDFFTLEQAGPVSHQILNLLDTPAPDLQLLYHSNLFD